MAYRDYPDSKVAAYDFLLSNLAVERRAVTSSGYQLSASVSPKKLFILSNESTTVPVYFCLAPTGSAGLSAPGVPGFTVGSGSTFGHYLAPGQSVPLYSTQRVGALAINVATSGSGASFITLSSARTGI